MNLEKEEIRKILVDLLGFILLTSIFISSTTAMLIAYALGNSTFGSILAFPTLVSLIALMLGLYRIEKGK